ncbi:MAG: hypothetical protein QM733_10915 [Ilumatobacteraceae bacterium]
MKARRLAVGFGALVLAGTTLLACGSDSTSTETATVETYTTVPDADVVSGLAATQALIDAIVADPTTASSTTVDAVNNSWLVYEGNIRLNDAATYLDAEDALALFSKAALGNDAAGMKTAADKFRTLAATYTAAHPG